MAVREIIRMGHPTLRKVARTIEAEELARPALRELVYDMVDTLHDVGGIGLAAPQVNESIRLVIIDMPGGSSRYGEIPALPLTVFVNPEIELLEGDTAGYWEGCLSVPGLRGFVERPQHLIVRALDLDGKPFALEMRGFPATVVQHEFDHLDGKLYVDRLKDTRLLVFEDQLAAGEPILED